MTQPLIELKNISKYFGTIEALKSVSMTVAREEVLCLLGDNGAGKSSLIKILSGSHAPSGGEMRINGQPVKLASPREARLHGIATVHQDVGNVPLMSVGRNFFLGMEPKKGWGPFRYFDLATANKIAVEQIRSFGITRLLSGDRLVGTLSGGERQVLAIARAVYFGAKLLILDEPTSALGVKESAKVLKMIELARERGVGIILITHNVRHAMQIGDRFVVLAHGEVLAHFNRGEKNREEIISLMAGGEEEDR